MNYFCFPSIEKSVKGLIKQAVVGKSGILVYSIICAVVNMQYVMSLLCVRESLKR